MSVLLSVLSQDRCKVAALKNLYEMATGIREIQLGCQSVLQQLEPEHLWRPIWILRRSNADLPLTEDDLRRIAESIDEPSHWAARLCVCQLFADTGCPESVREAMFPYLAHAFTDRRPIVRAWALSALCTFQADPRYQPEIRRMGKVAHLDTAKSMQARLRHLPVAFSKR
jgi:hypothetical protein